MKVLVACEWSARVRDAFRGRGHDAWSADLQPTAGDPRYHLHGDVRLFLDMGWDLMIAFPPCTYLSNVANSYLHSELGRMQKRWDALDFVEDLMDAPIPRIAIENPAGCIGRYIRCHDQIIHPYMFGDPYKKRTFLWLKNLPPLQPDRPYRPHGTDYPSWVNGGAGGIHSHDAKTAGMTFPGIARAMSEQWGSPHDQ